MKTTGLPLCLLTFAVLVAGCGAPESAEQPSSTEETLSPPRWSCDTWIDVGGFSDIDTCSDTIGFEFQLRHYVGDLCAPPEDQFEETCIARDGAAVLQQRKCNCGPLPAPSPVWGYESEPLDWFYDNQTDCEAGLDFLSQNFAGRIGIPFRNPPIKGLGEAEKRDGTCAATAQAELRTLSCRQVDFSDTRNSWQIFLNVNDCPPLGSTPFAWKKVSNTTAIHAIIDFEARNGESKRVAQRELLKRASGPRLGDSCIVRQQEHWHGVDGSLGKLDGFNASTLQVQMFDGRSPIEGQINPWSFVTEQWLCLPR
jgi:hypothetical protein